MNKLNLRAEKSLFKVGRLITSTDNNLLYYIYKIPHIIAVARGNIRRQNLKYRSFHSSANR